jgi:hypothetical protein
MRLKWAAPALTSLFTEVVNTVRWALLLRDLLVLRPHEIGRPRARSGAARAVALLERGAAIPSSTHGALDAGSDTIIDQSYAVAGLDVRLTPTLAQKCIVEPCSATTSHEHGWCASHGTAADVCMLLAFIHDQVDTGAADLSEAIQSARDLVGHLEFLSVTNEWRTRLHPTALSPDRSAELVQSPANGAIG